MGIIVLTDETAERLRKLHDAEGSMGMDDIVNLAIDAYCENRERETGDQLAPPLVAPLLWGTTFRYCQRGHHWIEMFGPNNPTFLRRESALEDGPDDFTCGGVR